MGQTTFTPDSIYVTGAGLVGRSSGSGLCSLLDAAAIRTVAGLGTMATQASASYLALSGGTLTGNLLFTDATYDIGASGATRPRDLHLSRNVTAGNQVFADSFRMANNRSFSMNDTAGSSSAQLTMNSSNQVRLTNSYAGNASMLIGNFSTLNTNSIQFWLANVQAHTLSTSGATFTGSTVIAGLSSTSTSRSQGQLVGSWVDSTDATRKAQVVESVYDTAARAVARSFANGTNGYKAFKMATSAPADADLANSEIVFYDNAGTPSWKFKNSSGTVTTGAL